MTITVSGQQIQGDRDYQEDSFQILKDVQLADDKTGLLLVLCDGMGGHAGGEVASEIVCDTFRQSFEAAEGEVLVRLELALEQARLAVLSHTQSNPEHQGMGTTIIAVCIVDNNLFWISVGDSPLWLCRQGELTRLNADHSMAPIFDKMVEMGELTAEAAAHDPKRHALRSVVNGEVLRDIDLASEPFILQADDQILLASDGVETLTDSAIISLLNQSKQACDADLETLLAAVSAEKKPKQDNASAILAQISVADEADTVKKEPKEETKCSSKTLLITSFIFLIVIIVYLLVKMAGITTPLTAGHEDKQKVSTENESINNHEPEPEILEPSLEVKSAPNKDSEAKGATETNSGPTLEQIPKVENVPLDENSDAAPPPKQQVEKQQNSSILDLPKAEELGSDAANNELPIQLPNTMKEVKL
mgnify:CR=1 FL=1